MQRVQRSTLLTALVAGCALAGAANAQVIRITNVNGSTGHDIPLKANSSVQIDSAGNLLAECALNSSNVCTALSTGGGTTNPDAPTATLTRADNDSDVRTGENIRLAWSSTLAEVCKASSAGPVTTGWNGVRIAADGGGELVNLSTVGTYTFSLVCYNAAGASTASTQVVAVTAAASGGENPPPTPPAGCTITSNDPNFNPTTFARVNKAWVQTFSAPDGSPQAVYPSGVSFPAPVGASKGTYVTVAFTPNPSQSVNMYWDQVQSRSQDGYPSARPAQSMFIGISPCPGDLRNVAGVNNPDQFLRPGCRKFEGSGSLVWTTSASVSQSDDSQCKLEAGQTYYLHIMPANPEGGLQAGEHSCMDVANSAQGCDVGVVFQSGPG
jgi:hypothetical protein